MECKICYEIMPKEKIKLLCGHSFCKKCFLVLFDANIGYPVLCFSCKRQPEDKEYNWIFRGPDRKRFEMYRKNYIDSFDNFLHKCRNPNCDGEIRHFESTKLLRFTCPKCMQITCIKCKATHRKGEKCKDWKRAHTSIITERERQNNEMQMHIQKKNAMICVTCGTYIERDQGCYGIKCSICRTELCLITQKRRWGPKGPGDLSEGCGCTVTRKCDPKCDSCNVDDFIVPRFGHRQFLSLTSDFSRLFQSFMTHQQHLPIAW